MDNQNSISKDNVGSFGTNISDSKKDIASNILNQDQSVNASYQETITMAYERLESLNEKDNSIEMERNYSIIEESLKYQYKIARDTKKMLLYVSSLVPLEALISFTPVVVKLVLDNRNKKF